MIINIDSTEQSRVRLQLQPTPRCAGSASPELEAAISASPDPEAAIFASPDLEAAGSASSDSWVCAPPRSTLRPRAPPRQTPWVRAPSRLTGTHIAANHSRSSVWVWVKTLTPRKTPARLDVTRDHDGPYLRIHIKNSVGRTDDVLPNPRTNTDRRVSSPRCPPGRSGAP